MCYSMASRLHDLAIVFMSTCTMDTLQLHHTVCSQGVAPFLILKDATREPVMTSMFYTKQKISVVVITSFLPAM